MPRSKGREPRNLGRVTPYRATPYVAGEGRLFAIEREADHQEAMRSRSDLRKRPRPLADSPPYPAPSYTECRFCRRGIQRGAPCVTARLGFGASGVVHGSCAIPPEPNSGHRTPPPGQTRHAPPRTVGLRGLAIEEHGVSASDPTGSQSVGFDDGGHVPNRFGDIRDTAGRRHVEGRQMTQSDPSPTRSRPTTPSRPVPNRSSNVRDATAPRDREERQTAAPSPSAPPSQPKEVRQSSLAGTASARVRLQTSATCNRCGQTIPAGVAVIRHRWPDRTAIFAHQACSPP